MKTHISPIAKWVSAALITVGAGALSANAIAATPADTTISNTAVVTYQDETGNEYTAQSDAATIKVAQIYSATLEQDQTVTGARGQQVVTAHTLTNTGNGSDTYTITYGDDLPAGDTRAPGNDTIDATAISMVWDTNNDGKADPGEPIITSGDTITLAGGEAAQLLLLTTIPTSATAADSLGVQMTVVAAEGPNPDAPVTNVGDNFDSTDGTNADLINVTTNAVINFTKSSTHLVDQFTESDVGLNLDGDTGTDLPVNVIKYVIEATNVGEKPASDVVIFDGAPAGTTIITTGAMAPTHSGLVETGDTITTRVPDITDEGTIGEDLDQDGNTDASESTFGNGGLDLNNDGDTTDSGIEGVYAVDDSLPKNTKVSVEFYVAYMPTLQEGNENISNVAYFCADLDGDGLFTSEGECQDPNTNTSGPKPTPPTTTTTEEETGGTIDPVGPGSSGEGGEPKPSDPTGTQVIPEVPAGSEVFFYNLVTNTGNTDDIFNLETDLGTFPTGTTVKYMNGTGTVTLNDNNTDGIDDTGNVAPSTCSDPDTVIDGITVKCNQKLIRVVLKLPIDAASATAPFVATTTATSVNDGTVSDSKKEEITNGATPPTTDISNTPFTDPNSTVNQDAINIGDGALNPSDFASVIDSSSTPKPTLGSTHSMPIYIANEGGSSDSYLLRAQGSWNATTGWDMNVPDGWTVVFKHAGIDLGHDGTIDPTDIQPTGDVITETPSIPGGAVMFVTMEVTIPSDPTKAKADSDQADAVNANFTGVGGDEDLDYVISVLAESKTSGAKDRKAEAFDIETTSDINITPPTGSNQIEPNGTITYNHTLVNAGNTSEPIDLTTSNNQPGFTSTIDIDTNGDGTPDTSLENLCAKTGGGTNTITVMQNDGTTATIDVICDNADDTTPILKLEPGEEVPFVVIINAPNAPEGQQNVTTVTATTNTGEGGTPGVTATGTDTSEVAVGQVRLKKFADLDADCNGTADTAQNFQTAHTTRVEPGQCVIWKLVAINEGSQDAVNTKIADQRTEFTVFADSGTTINTITPSVTNGGVVACRNLNTTDSATIVGISSAAHPIKDSAARTAVGEICVPSGATGGDITSSITGDDVTFEVGTLVPGDKAVGHFVVQVK